MMKDPKLAAMVEAMLERNENFRGTSVDEEKMNLFADLRRQAEELAHLMHAAVTVRPPENTARNAMVMLDIPLPVGIFNESVRKRLSALIASADDVSFAAPSGETLRITFGIQGVWKE